ncbi:MAG: PDZ domain-containing protein, partial [Acidimicrobiia bacterium]|nr:PDZ domain-containing protein [Acidimicrobiia bacterium]
DPSPGSEPAPPQVQPATPQPLVYQAGRVENAPTAPAPQPGPAPAPSSESPAAPAQEPVVFAAGRVEPSVVLIQTTQGQGSGIIYDDAGLVLTAAHVVEEAEPLLNLFGDGEGGGPGPSGDLDVVPPEGSGRLEIPEALGGEVPDVIVHLANGLRTGGKVVGANRELDVAVVQIDPALDLAVAEIGPLSTVQVGQTAVAVGSPFGMENVVTVGVVSALNQVLGGENVPPLGMIQTDAPINSGNSGGALADIEGRVIGMNILIRSTFGGGNIGVGFATPIEVAIWIAEELRAGREVRFGFLGITGYTPQLGEPGAIVASVTPGGPAEAAGMQINDRIVAFDGQPVASMNELTVAVRLRAPGTEVPVEVIRGDQLIRLFIPLGDRSASLDIEQVPDESLEPEIEP